MNFFGHVTGHTGHMTRDIWHMTHGKWHMTHSVLWTCSQNFSSLALPVWDWQRLEYIWTKGSLNEWMNKWMDRGDYRTAPATQGLLNIMLLGSWKSALKWPWKTLKKILLKSTKKTWNCPTSLPIFEALTIHPTNFLRPLFDSQFFLSFNFCFGHKTPWV